MNALLTALARGFLVGLVTPVDEGYQRRTRSRPSRPPRGGGLETEPIPESSPPAEPPPDVGQLRWYPPLILPAAVPAGTPVAPPPDDDAYERCCLLYGAPGE